MHFKNFIHKSRYQPHVKTNTCIHGNMPVTLHIITQYHTEAHSLQANHTHALGGSFLASELASPGTGQSAAGVVVGWPEWTHERKGSWAHTSSKSHDHILMRPTAWQPHLVDVCFPSWSRDTRLTLPTHHQNQKPSTRPHLQATPGVHRICCQEASTSCHWGLNMQFTEYVLKHSGLKGQARS